MLGARRKQPDYGDRGLRELRSLRRAGFLAADHFERLFLAELDRWVAQARAIRELPEGRADAPS